MTDKGGSNQNLRRTCQNSQSCLNKEKTKAGLELEICGKVSNEKLRLSLSETW